jgi:hypothetical protein
MRPSPFRYPLALLRSIVGLTQKELGGMVGCTALQRALVSLIFKRTHGPC